MLSREGHAFLEGFDGGGGGATARNKTVKRGNNEEVEEQKHGGVVGGGGGGGRRVRRIRYIDVYFVCSDVFIFKRGKNGGMIGG